MDQRSIPRSPSTAEYWQARAEADELIIRILTEKLKQISTPTKEIIHCITNLAATAWLVANLLTFNRN